LFILNFLLSLKLCLSPISSLPPEEDDVESAAVPEFREGLEGEQPP
jgi:hypothetical protein